MQEMERLARRGWRLLPCAPRGKKPLLKSWPALASADLATIRRWAAKHRGCNWGVATGPESGVFVLDVDGEAGRASLAALETQHRRLPATLISRTKRGEHRWFNYPNGRPVRGSAGKLGQGLDIRGAGGYVIVPPSIHASGHLYQWVNADQSIADAPNWLLDLLNGGSRVNGHRPAAIFGVLVEGLRNDTLFRFGCAMRRRGATQDEIERRLLQKNDRECKPLLETDEVCKIAASAARYEPSGPDPLETAWGNVLSESHPRGYEQFIALARNLQNARPKFSIALPLKRIGEHMGCDWTQVRRWRQYAVRDGWLRLKEIDIPHVKAALYTFHEISTSTVPLKAKCPTSRPTSGLAGQAEVTFSGTLGSQKNPLAIT